MENMRFSGSTVISVTDVLAAYNGYDKRRGKPRFFFWLIASARHGLSGEKLRHMRLAVRLR